MYYDELSEEEVFLQNMIADSIEQQSEYMDMQAMYEANELEI